ncbi:MAG: HK97 family phage prohead protease [Armatimonadota bacterium]|nr:HK97 family phage prohead protease [Armatimonadota bacterium]
MRSKQITLQLDETSEGSVRAVFATFGVVDRDNEVTVPGAFEDGAEVRLSAWNHASWSQAGLPALPVGKGRIRSTDREAIFEGHFFLNTLSGREHYETVKALGGLQEWSYGFDVLDSTEDEVDGRRVVVLRKLKVHEVAPVILGAGIGTRTLEVKGLKQAIPPHETERAPEDMPWDGPAAVRDAPNEAAVLRRMHAWVDPEGDPDAKSSYKLPHHLPDGRVVWRGVAAAMAALLGGRGGVDIPEADRRGVYRHLARHYEQFEREPPEFRGLPLEEEYALTVASLADARQFVGRLRSLADLRAKEGRVLSQANRERLSRLLQTLQEVEADIARLLAETDPAREDTVRQRLRSEWLRYRSLLTVGG